MSISPLILCIVILLAIGLFCEAARRSGHVYARWFEVLVLIIGGLLILQVAGLLHA